MMKNTTCPLCKEQVNIVEVDYDYSKKPSVWAQCIPCGITVITPTFLETELIWSVVGTAINTENSIDRYENLW